MLSDDQIDRQEARMVGTPQENRGLIAQAREANALRAENEKLRAEIGRRDERMYADHEGGLAWLLDYLGDEALVEKARKELTALRSRVADLEMMLRAALDRSLVRHFSGCFGGEPAGLGLQLTPTGLFYIDGFGHIQGDGTGLPLLTPDSRDAMRKVEKGG